MQCATHGGTCAFQFPDCKPDDRCLQAIAELFQAEMSRRTQADIALATAVSAAIDEGHPADAVFAVLRGAGTESA
jgi:hypothetical protein